MEVINSFFSNIKDKLTNPFFGTLIIVLILHHWELWYAILNFDDGFNLNQKIEFIEKYISENLTFLSFLWDIGQAFIYMFIGYLIVVFTRSLVLWVEFGLMPLITGKVVNKNVVRRSEYDEVVKEREEYFDQYEEQRKNVRNFSKTIDEQNEQIKEKDKNLLEQSKKISSTVHELDQTKSKLEKFQENLEEARNDVKSFKNQLEDLQMHFNYKVDVVQKYQSLFLGKENEEFYSSKEKFPPEVLKKANELADLEKWPLFIAVAKFYNQGGSIGGEAVTEMQKLDLVFDRDSREELTPIGRILWKYRNLFASEFNYDIY